PEVSLRAPAAPAGRAARTAPSAGPVAGPRCRWPLLAGPRHQPRRRVASHGSAALGGDGAEPGAGGHRLRTPLFVRDAGGLERPGRAGPRRPALYPSLPRAERLALQPLQRVAGRGARTVRMTVARTLLRGSSESLRAL